MIRARSTFEARTPFREGARALRTFGVSVALAAALAACAATPIEGEAERLDEGTGTTVTVMPKPVEFIVDRTRGPKTDPFAYLAPFETNRMGSHELFLWVSAPQVAGPLGVPQVFCGEQSIPLESLTVSMSSIGLSGAPYKVPAPWSTQWFFKLSGEVLDCFAGARKMKIVTKAGDEEPDTYTAEAATLSGLNDFVTRVRT
ncbi:MAG: hypothetical protein ABI885_17335 [Gammaproteobacteria bacterium]